MKQDQIEAAMVRATRPDPMESIWRMNIDALVAGAYGDPKDPATLVRYWRDQASAGFPGALENLRFFDELAKKTRPKTVEDRVAEIKATWELCEQVWNEQQKKGKTTP